MQLSLRPTADGTVVEMTSPAGTVTVEPLRVGLLSGPSLTCGYDYVDAEGGALVGHVRRSLAGVMIVLEDRWEAEGDGVALVRRFDARGGADDDGIQVALHVVLPERRWRWFVPGSVYSPSQYGDYRRAFSDQRASVPLVGAFEPDLALGVVLRRTRYAAFDAPADRKPGERRYLQATDVGSVGFDPRERPTLHASWPYAEEDTSAALDAAGTPAVAFYPLKPDGVSKTLCYALDSDPSPTFGAMASSAYRRAWRSAPPSRRPKAYTLRQSIEYRTESMAKTYTEWGADGAGFLLNFDSERGYEHEAKAFGSSFVEHGMTGSHSILEYGFTGRQLDVALSLAKALGGKWERRAVRVADHFVGRMTTPSGWVWTLWNIAGDMPLYSCGDPSGPVMHYLGEAPAPGAHTRTMTEAVGDLLAGYRLARHPEWLAACKRFGDFLLRAQEPDGSWYRAYTPEGRALHSAWLGEPGPSGKSATSVAIPFLLELTDALEGSGGSRYEDAARRAGAYVLEHQVAADDYRGGTLDNPNVVDKEASLLVMRAMLRLYEATNTEGYLRAAVRAAGVAITWHCAWNVPLLPGTAVAEAGGQSPGWGGINDVWGAGVTDIYTLFFLRDLQRLSRICGDTLLAEICTTIAWSSTDVLADRRECFGLADVGMQPEGISFCDQGVDDGMIHKGDRWGGLAWLYSAGTTALGSYLDELQADDGKSELATIAPNSTRNNRNGST